MTENDLQLRKALDNTPVVLGVRVLFLQQRQWMSRVKQDRHVMLGAELVDRHCAIVVRVEAAVRVELQALELTASEPVRERARCAGAPGRRGSMPANGIKRPGYRSAMAIACAFMSCSEHRQ